MFSYTSKQFTLQNVTQQHYAKLDAINSNVFAVIELYLFIQTQAAALTCFYIHVGCGAIGAFYKCFIGTLCACCW